MLYIKRDNESVVIEVDTDLPFDCQGTQVTAFAFSYSTSEPWIAQLLKERIQSIIGDAVKKARKEAYEQGWKDAKAKRRKETWFDGWL